jgi:hypothetical protein
MSLDLVGRTDGRSDGRTVGRTVGPLFLSLSLSLSLYIYIFIYVFLHISYIYIYIYIYMYLYGPITIFYVPWDSLNIRREASYILKGFLYILRIYCFRMDFLYVPNIYYISVPIPNIHKYIEFLNIPIFPLWCYRYPTHSHCLPVCF